MGKKGQCTAFTQEQMDYIYNNVTGRSNQELTDIFNAAFGTNKTLASIRKFKFKHNLYSGIVHIPVYSEGRDVGSIRHKEGRLFIKNETNDWVPLNKYIWEKANGPIPKGFVLIFGDSNPMNCELDNLILISRQQLITMNCCDLIKDEINLTRTGIIIADLVNKIGKRNIITKGV